MITDRWTVIVARANDRHGVATLERSLMLTPLERTLVWDPRGRFFGRPGLHARQEPTDAGTGPLALLAAAWIARSRPLASVVFMPGDATVSDDLRFMDFVCQAIAWVELHPRHVVVLGAPPRRAGAWSSWLLPRSGAHVPFLPWQAMVVERPNAALAAELYVRRAFWSTGVIVANVRTLMQLIAAFAPDWWEARDALLDGDDGALFASLAPFDLSKDVLARAREHTYVLPLEGVDWSGTCRAGDGGSLEVDSNAEPDVSGAWVGGRRLLGRGEGHPAR